ncbi:hypothetical protein [Sandarakinorhabdus sp. DWP1-3-1]|uniref:hypothetical protein n=1 Tax=Sandarakinorhabdus sp. DWP1-3-1 TaxID=2804627 RepID=UPI003CF48F21
MARPNPWKAREADLRAMVAAGDTMAVIAARYGVKEQAANMACWRLGIRVPKAVKSVRSSALKRRQWADPAYRERITAASRASYHAGHGHRLSVRGRGSRLQGVPPEHHDTYFALYHKLRDAAEVRRILALDVAAEQRRRADEAAARSSLDWQHRHHAMMRGGGRIAPTQVAV